MYYLYHIPGKKVGVTTNLEERVHKQQGYYPGEYEIIEQSEDIDFISEGERIMQRFYKYRVDNVLYSELKFNKNNNMKHVVFTVWSLVVQIEDRRNASKQIKDS